MHARPSSHPRPVSGRTRMRRFHQALIATALLALAMVLAGEAVAQTADDTALRPANRAQAAAIIAESRRIVVPGGIERLERVRIGGIEQWLSIRGRDPRNPVLLVIHGGPGYVSMPMAWWNTRHWEEFFTVVHWDQRGAGKTHRLTPAESVAPTLTLDRMYGDAEEVVAWLREDLGKPRIFVLGHSWGTYLGLRLAHERPEWLHAYVGVAQITDMRENELRNWRTILERARDAGNAQAVSELEALAPYAVRGREVPMADIYTQRRWGERFGGTLAWRDNNAAESALVRLSPEYTDDDVRHAWDGNAFAGPLLFTQILDIDVRPWQRFEIPLFIALGRHDTIVSNDLVAEWFDGIKAPGKRITWFEQSAHSPMAEEPGRFLLELVTHVRPIAERAGDMPTEDHAMVPSP